MCWMCEAAYPIRRSRWRSYAQFNDLPLGAEAGTQQTMRMEPLQPLGVAYVRLRPDTCLASRALTRNTTEKALGRPFRAHDRAPTFPEIVF